MPTPFDKSVQVADEILAKGKKVLKGQSMEEAGIGLEWMESYANIAEHADRSRRYGMSRYPYEASPSIQAFVGGFFDHKEWPIRKGMEKHQSLRGVSEYEAKYINSAGYWAAFHESAITLRQEKLESDEELAARYDVWAIISIRYVLRVLGMRVEFYKMAALDPTEAKMRLLRLERRGTMAAADDLDEVLAEMESHSNTQLMKAVATLSASNATKRAKGKGGATADGN